MSTRSDVSSSTPECAVINRAVHSHRIAVEQQEVRLANGGSELRKDQNHLSINSRSQVVFPTLTRCERRGFEVEVGRCPRYGLVPELGIAVEGWLRSSAWSSDGHDAASDVSNA